MKDYKVGKETMSDAFCREVYAVVRDIPAGKVISYGEIAALLGKPQCSRMVGRSLKQVPLDLNLPCHRVGLFPGGKSNGPCCNSKVSASKRVVM